MTARENTTRRTYVLTNDDTATTRLVEYVDGPDDASVTTQVFDRVDHVYTARTQQHYVPFADAGACGLLDSGYAMPLRTGVAYRQPHTRDQYVTLIAGDDDAARTAAHDWAAQVLGEAVLGGAQITESYVSVTTPEDIAAMADASG